MYDVAIVGYGPVGAMFANLLGQAGHRVVVIERQPSVYHMPRAAHFDHEAMRVFQAVGLEEKILPATCGIDGMHLINGDRQLLLAFDQPPGPTPVAYANDFMFHQPQLELAMREGVGRFPNVEVLLRHEVVGLLQAAEGDPVGDGDGDGGGHVVLDVADLAGGGTATVAARWVIGCDGARSVVRSLAALTFEDFGFDESWLVVDLLMRRPVGLPTVCQQICDPRRPTTYVPMPEPRRRFEFMVLPGEDASDLEREDRVYELLSPWLGRDDADVERAVVYTFTAGVAPSWRSGRVLLAGDAAHLMPPFLGQGMCSGIRDAANLAWKLDLVLRGRASGALLDTYATERLAHVRAIIDVAVSVGRMICLLDIDAAATRDSQMIAARRRDAGADGSTGEAGQESAGAAGFLPPLGPGLHRGGADGVAGRLFIQPWVTVGSGAAVRLDDALGPGFALLVRHGDPRAALAELLSADGDDHAVADASAISRWMADGGRLVTCDPAAAAVADQSDASGEPDEVVVIGDRDGFLGAWFDRHRSDAVLLRPDRYVLASRPCGSGGASGV